MKQDEIIEMAIKAELNLYVHDLTEKQYIQVIETFAKLVAAKEREACLAIAEKQRYAMNISLTSLPAQNGTAVDIANAIRARGEAV